MDDDRQQRGKKNLASLEVTVISVWREGSHCFLRIGVVISGVQLYTSLGGRARMVAVSAENGGGSCRGVFCCMQCERGLACSLLYAQGKRGLACSWLYARQGFWLVSATYAVHFNGGIRQSGCGATGVCVLAAANGVTRCARSVAC